VTAYVQAEKNAGHNVIGLAPENPGDSTNYCDFNSREASSNTRQLIVTGG